MSFWTFYQSIPLKLSPEVFSFGFLSLDWYSFFYLVAFLTIGVLIWFRIRKGEDEKILGKKFNRDQFFDFFIYSIIGILAGGRIGYVLFYDLHYFLINPLEIFLPYNFSTGTWVGISGMSYHGGVLGLVVALLLFSRRYSFNFWRLSDFLVPAIPLGYFFGRIGNFFNGELFGRVTEKTWGMHFSFLEAQEKILRHPSQIYEALGEGILLFFLLWFLRNKIYFSGSLTALYLAGYALIRFFIEFVRQPDPQIGLIFGLSMGQILCVIMLLASIVIFFARKKHK